MTETTPEAREAVTYPVEERAFHVIRYTSDRDVDQFRASDRATLSSFPARDRDDAYAMAETLNRVVRFHVERALALSPPAISEAVEAEREGLLRDLVKALEAVLPYTEAERLAEAAAVRCGAFRNPIDTAVRAARATAIRARTSISEVVG